MTDSKKYLAFIIMLASVIFTFFINGLIGLILAILALIFSIKNKNKKNMLNTFALLGAIIIIIVFIISFVKSYNVTKENFDKATIIAHQLEEKKLINNAQMHILESGSKIEPNSENNTYIMRKDVLGPISNACEGYVIYDINKDNYKAYISCKDGYKTEGFNKDLLNK